ncbi:ribosomal protein S17 [Candidatus Dojkabacteria bacterium]|uniref:Ribosomal protein S17 n=1 Tax=Candidatus Dojkabacteria bacterium TaxID=2099670 RepID=A0A3M0YZ89_9BACT|nr:MAG: ribosomal protein S17 [Candidatus Dojkabacteria bacterium]
MESKKIKLRYNGVIEKISSSKTVSVRVEFRFPHPKYSKIVKSSKKVLVHVDDEKQFKVGDKVTIESCRRISKNKSFRVILHYGSKVN